MSSLLTTAQRKERNFDRVAERSSWRGSIFIWAMSSVGFEDARGKSKIL